MLRSLLAMPDRGLTVHSLQAGLPWQGADAASSRLSAGGQQARHNRADSAGLAPCLPRRLRLFKGLAAQRLVALFVAGWTLLSFPLLALWDHDLTLLGVPMLPAMLFLIWALLIAAVAWIAEHSAD